MKLTNYDDRFGLVSKFLHWSIALLVAFQFAGGISGIERDAHASAGLLVLVLAAIRVVWRMAVPLPDWAPGLTGFERRLVHLYEMVIYLMLFAKPITGLLLLGADDREVELFGMVELQPVIGESKDGEDLFESLHLWSGAILGAALTVHIGLVLRHQFLLKDGMLFRMWPFGRPRWPGNSLLPLVPLRGIARYYLQATDPSQETVASWCNRNPGLRGRDFCFPLRMSRLRPSAGLPGSSSARPRRR